MKIYNRILFNHKKVETLAICNNMDGLWGQYDKWNKSERDKWAHVWSHLYMESETVELIFKKIN